MQFTKFQSQATRSGPRETQAHLPTTQLSVRAAWRYRGGVRATRGVLVVAIKTVVYIQIKICEFTGKVKDQKRRFQQTNQAKS